MSRIQKKTVPHAAGADVDLKSPETRTKANAETSGAFSQLAGKVREHPGYAAAGVAAVVGVAAAAAAIPAIRGRRSASKPATKPAAKRRSKAKKKA